MARDLKGLTNIEVVSGLAERDGEYRGFITIRALAEDGSIMTGQLDPDEIRQMAMQFFSAAEAADQDRMVMSLMVTEIGLPEPEAAGFIRLMRDSRGK